MLDNFKEILNPENNELWPGMTQSDRINVHEKERIISLMGGSLLALLGLFRRPPGGPGLLLAGGYLIYRGLTGHCPAYRAAGLNSAKATGQHANGGDPTTHYLPEAQQRPAGTIEAESSVDEAAWESFPASDPPAWTASRVGEPSPGTGS